MLEFEVTKDPKTGETILKTPLSGKTLLTSPQLNKGTAFTYEERHEFGLLGKLPAAAETLPEQTMRAFIQYSAFATDLQKSIYLRTLHETNETVFYKLVADHMKEMIPVLYTPIVGTAVKTHSTEFRRPRGLYISYPDREYIREILSNRTHPEIDVIVVTDGEGVLGIGDQGIGGIDIPIAKLMVYSIAAGINPLRTLPIMLDTGTNNQALLDDPLYLGWRQNRIAGEKYDEFIRMFIDEVKKQFPGVYLHWEDFGRDNAQRNLTTYRNEICSFNDDIQGTGVVTLAAMLAAVHASGTSIKDQRFVIFGAGSAGLGITHQLCDALIRNGMDEKEARSRFWLISSSGLITSDTPELSTERALYARDPAEIQSWKTTSAGIANLEDVINNVHPTVLIGCSTVGSAFTETVVKAMASHCERPIIFPLSNPTERSEATPADILEWTQGKALIATGSPFAPVDYHGKTIPIGQCNNALVYPGIGLGIMAVKAKRLSDDMLWAACEAAAQFSPILKNPDAALLPPIEEARPFSNVIALAVASQAVKEGLATVSNTDNISGLIDAIKWEPKYLRYIKV
ncbi:MAG: NAD-dependent malic enzyme [Gammaproteobacteria bacterium]|nr:NAD-dependent malic enzyme [Gammaproteobacteria bacterium]